MAVRAIKLLVFRDLNPNAQWNFSEEISGLFYSLAVGSRFGDQLIDKTGLRVMLLALDLHHPKF